MKYNFNSSFKFLEYLVTLYGELRFGFSQSPYGKEFYWTTDIKESDSVEKLITVLFEFDEEYHDECELERGSSRVYVLELENDILIGNIRYEWDYSYLGSKWTNGNLVELIKDNICTTFSKRFVIPKDEFYERYYYEIIFSTEDFNQEDRFFLADWENDNDMKIPSSIWTGLKDSIINLSNKHGANTAESICQFSYNLNHEHHDVIESWSDELELDKFKNDKIIYKAK